MAPVVIVPVRPPMPPIWVLPLKDWVEIPMAFEPEAVMVPEEVMSMVSATAEPLVVAKMP